MDLSGRSYSWNLYRSEYILPLEYKVERRETLDSSARSREVLNNVDLSLMYRLVKTHSHLEWLHREVLRLGRLDSGSEAEYGATFFSLIVRGRSEPTSSQLEGFLDRGRRFYPAIETLFDRELPKVRLDEALRGVINYLIRTWFPIYGEIPRKVVNAAVGALLRLLERGANLALRQPHEVLHLEQSSLAALIELVDLVPAFPLGRFSRYICCPLTNKRDRVDFDDSRIARLSCLAARNLGLLSRRTKLPNALRLWVRMHQDLRLLLRNDPWRMIVVMKIMVPNDFEYNQYMFPRPEIPPSGYWEPTFHGRVSVTAGGSFSDVAESIARRRRRR